MSIISDIQMSKHGWFSDDSGQALTTLFGAFDFGFTSFSITLFNDAESGSIEYSFDGQNVHGRVMPGEMRKMDFCRHETVWLRGQNGTEPYRLEVY
ncbi:MAG: hypothetical protein JW765_09835 [Deltaproteobacteria bacterium]|nr:hypothetical protein [Candidatus Zymogenaceae bacterium]